MKRNILVTALIFLCLQAVAAVERDQPQPAVLADDEILPDTIAADSLYADSLSLDSLPESLHPLVWDYVEQNELIAFLLQTHRNAMMDQRGIPGYRVHLYMDSGNRARLSTQREQADFQELYPEKKSYIIYDEPYFKLRAGDFRTRLDARRFLAEIREDYPSAYIVVDMINYPDLD
jgi:hypothetical protein